MKFKQLKVSILALMLVMFFSCNKSDNPDIELSSTFTVENAQAWFNKQIEGSNNQMLPATAPNKFYNIPDWEKAEFEKGANNIAYWKIPLNSRQMIVRRLTDFRKGQEPEGKFLPRPWLLIYQDSAHNTKMLVMQSVPGQAKKEDDTGFNGEVRMYHWNGNLEVGFIYQNGRKQMQITPANNLRKRADNPNARWEFVCKTYVECEFQAQCGGSTSSEGFIVFMAFAQTRDELSCSSPTEDPYSSASSYNSGAQWSCQGWTQTNSRTSTECGEIWIDDIPDPEPEPYIPDPTLEQGYGVQNIDNQLKDPCHRQVANDIINYRLCSGIVERANRIFGVSDKVNLIFKDRDQFNIDRPTDVFKDTWNGAAGVQNQNGIKTVSIYLNTPKFANASKEATAHVFLHELVHAILSESGRWTADQEHEKMAKDYYVEMNAVLMDFFGISEKDAQALNLSGLQDTVLGATLIQAFPETWGGMVDTIRAYIQGTKGSRCN